MRPHRAQGDVRFHARRATAILGLLVAAASWPAAAQTPPTPSPVGVTAGTLAEMCASGAGTDMISAASVGYCRGFLIATGQYHAELTAGPAGRPPVFCLPTPSPTIEAAQDAFVAWVRDHPEAAGEKALIGVMRWAATAYPCPARPASGSSRGSRR